MSTNQKQDHKQYHLYTRACAISILILFLSYAGMIGYVRITKAGVGEGAIGFLIAITFTCCVIAVATSGQAHFFEVQIRRHSHGYRHVGKPANPQIYQPWKMPR